VTVHEYPILVIYYLASHPGHPHMQRTPVMVTATIREDIVIYVIGSAGISYWLRWLSLLDTNGPDHPDNMCHSYASLIPESSLLEHVEKN